MKTLVVALVAGGVGYVLGARAGHGRYEELKAKAADLAHSPQAQDAAAKVASEVKKNTGSLPDPVANVVNDAADALAEAPKTDGTPGSAGSSGPASS